MGWLESFPETLKGRSYLCNLYLLCSRESLGIRGGALPRAHVLVFISGIRVSAVTAQWIPLDFQALVGRGTCLSQSYGIAAIREIVVDRRLHPGHYTDSRFRPNPWLFMKEASVCPGALAWGVGLAYTCWTIEVFLRNSGYGGHLGTLPSSSSPVSSIKELIHLSTTLISIMATRGTLPGHLASSIYVYSPTRLYVSAYFKNCYLRIWLLVSLNLGAENFPLGTLTGPGISLITESY